MIAYTPYAIFSNSVPIFDINFFNPKTETKGNVDFGQGDTEIKYASESSAAILQPTIASWYITLRNFAVVALLSVLLYMSIRIIVGSINDKVKYKEKLKDWLVAMCLVFIIHYMMAFIVQISETAGTLFASSCAETILVKLPVDTKIDGQQLEADSETGYPIWACNFVGYSRLIAGGFAEYDTMKSVEFTIIYVVLVIYTVIFTIMYLKRVLYMAFLTIIAPLVALMYPIDKIGDGKAQGFDTWLKEYVFNALMQPFHMLTYSIVIGAVMDLAIKYPVYAVVALGFLIPAEKMLRKMLGFEKAQTPSNMGALGVAGAGLLMSGINKLTHSPRKNKEEKNDTKPGRNNVRMKKDDSDTIGNFASESLGESQIRENTGTLGSGMNNGELPQQGKSEHSFANSLTTAQVPNGIGEGMPGNILNNGSSSMFSDNTIGSEHSHSNSTSLGLAQNMSRNANNGTRGISNPNGRNKRKISNKIKNGIKNGFMAVGTKYSRKFAKTHPVRELGRKLGKGALYGLGAANLGMVGLVAGIASGDLGKTLQYTAAAGTIGGRQVSEIGDSILSEGAGNIGTIVQNWNNGDEEAIQKKQMRQLQSNPDNIDYLRERTSDYRKILKETYPEYASHGCTDIEDFWSAYQLEQAGASRNLAISTYELAQRTGDVSKSPDAENKWAKKLEEEFSETAVVKQRQEELTKQYMLKQKQEEEKYEEERQKIEDSKAKDKEEKLKEIQEQRQKRLEELQQEYKSKQQDITAMPNQLAKSALNNVKLFYKNK